MSYRPSVDVSDPGERAALVIYSTLLGGSMGSRLFDEIREQRGLAYSVHSVPHAYADVPVLQLSAGLDSSKCVEAYRRMRDIVTELREHGPTEAEVERARAYAAGARAIAFENTGAVARYAAQQTIVYGEDVDPGPHDRAARRGHSAEVTDIAGRDRRRAVGRVRRAAHGGGAGVGLRPGAWGALGGADGGRGCRRHHQLRRRRRSLDLRAGREHRPAGSAMRDRRHRRHAAAALAAAPAPARDAERGAAPGRPGHRGARSTT